MSETSHRRRIFGRSLIAAGALALPLTASISYAAANAQAPEPARPAPPIVAVDPDAPEAPAARDADGHRVRTFVLQRENEEGPPVVREFGPRHPQHPQPPQLNWQGDPLDPEFQARMEEFQREMERFRQEWAQNGQDWAQFGEEMAQWGEQHREQALAMAQQHRAQALAMAEQARQMAPQVVVNCDDAERPVRASRSDDGRQVLVICAKQMNRFARSSLRNARESIARNPELSDEVRRDILEDLDQEIERIERADD